MIKITYQGKTILLPGDAGGPLLAYHLLHYGNPDQPPNFAQLLSNIDIFIAPHHGSTENGEQLFLDAFAQQQKNKILFISSDPQQGNKLPKQWYLNEIKKLKIDNKLSAFFLTSYARSTFFKLSLNEEGKISVYDGQAQIY